MKARLAIFASGSGTNAEQIITHFHGHNHIEVAAVISNNGLAFVLERAKKFNIPTKVFSRHHFSEGDGVLNWLLEEKITHLILAGFMLLMPEKIIHAFHEKIINIHPALLPKFGGKGMYGHHVHEAVMASGEKETGITIHMVNGQYDEGRILFQALCQLDATDTPGTIAEKVHTLEHRHYPEQIEKWIMG